MSGRVGLLGLGGLIVMMSGGCTTPPGHLGVAADHVTRRVTVFYATDRAATSHEKDSVDYGWKRAYLEGDDPFQLGVCKVEIRRERNHDKPSPLPHSGHDLISLVSNSALGRTEFYDRLRDLMWNANTNETFVYVHGYNNDFEQAAKRTAELWYDIGFQGPPIMYSWPTRAGGFWRGIFGYFADGATIEWSAANLRVFLGQLVEETTPEKLRSDDPVRVHLIAHSMGCRALLDALALIADDLQDSERPIFCDVILAAPDIDGDVFRDAIAPRLFRRPVAEHFTLYASSADEALSASEMLQVYPRAGSMTSRRSLLSRRDLDTIDVSAVQGAGGQHHDYFVSEPVVIRDLIEILIRGDRNPGSAGRAMLRKNSSQKEPWQLIATGSEP